jgi:hypothetical protein
MSCAPHARWAAHGFDGLNVEAKTLQGSNDKRSCSQFVPETELSLFLKGQVLGVRK